MVSSRWVAGSSTGTLEFSVRRMMKKEITMNNNGAPAETPYTLGITACKIAGQLQLPGDPVKKDQDHEHGCLADNGKYASLAAPMPSKGEAVSMAAAIVKNRPRPKTYRTKITSPLKENTGSCPAMGRNMRTVIDAAREMTGPSLKIKVVQLL